MNWTLADLPDLTNKVAIITGANSGIGFETAKALAIGGATVVMACRNQSKAQEARENILSSHASVNLILGELDLSSSKSVRAFADKFIQTHNRLDILINNAGVMVPPYQLTEDGFELQFGSNYLGHFLLTGLLMKKIVSTQNSRIVSVSSIAHRKGVLNFDDLNSKKRYMKMKAYAQSKLACLMFAYELDRRLKKNSYGTISVAAHPGVTRSELVSHTALIKMLLFFAQNTPQGALPIIRAAVDLGVNGGEYYGPDGFLNWKGNPERERSSKSSYNETDAIRLWEQSELLTGLTYPLN